MDFSIPEGKESNPNLCMQFAWWPRFPFLFLTYIDTKLLWVLCSVTIYVVTEVHFKIIAFIFSIATTHKSQLL